MELRRRHLKLVSLYSARHAVRGGAGLVFLLLGLFFALVVAQVVITPVEHFADMIGERMDTRELVAELAARAKPAVTWAVGAADSRWADYLLSERPAILSAIFVVLLFGLTFVIPLGAFNQTAGDVGSRGIRYLLLRTERENLYFGRFLATSAFTAAVFAFAVLTIALYVGLKLQIYSAWEIATWSLHGFAALTLLSVPYVALCAWISGANDSPMISLVVATLTIGGIPLLSLLGGHYWEPMVYVKWLLPWGAQKHLLAPSYGKAALAAGACLLYTGAYLALGYRHFARRDL